MTRRSPPPCPCRGLWPRKAPRAFFCWTMNILAKMDFLVKMMCKLINSSSPEKNPPIKALPLKRVAVFHTCLFTCENGTREEQTTEVTYKNVAKNIDQFRRFLLVYYSASSLDPPALVRDMRAPLIHPTTKQIHFSVSPTTVVQFSECPNIRKVN